MAAFAQQADFFHRRYTYLENDIGRRPQLGRSVNDFGPRSAVGIVTAIRRISGAGFNGDFEAQLDEFLYDLRYCGNALLPCGRFPGNSYY
jgi:hypothetical protein